MNIQEYISSGIVELYAMGLCSQEERKEFETLLKQHHELKTALSKFEAELERKMQQNEIHPSAAADKKILAALDELNTPLVTMKPVTVIKKADWFKPLAVAASLLLAVSLYFIYSLNKENKKLEEQLVAATPKKEMPPPEMKKEMPPGPIDLSTLPKRDYEIMLDPTITPVAMYGVGLHAICRCTMFWDKKTGKMYMIIHHLPQSSSTRDYQLWAMVNNKPVSVGTVQDDIRGRFIEMNGVPNGATSFIVTLEKAGGNSTPTIEETYLSGKI